MYKVNFPIFSHLFVGVKKALFRDYICHMYNSSEAGMNFSILNIKENKN